MNTAPGLPTESISEAIRLLREVADFEERNADTIRNLAKGAREEVAHYYERAASAEREAADYDAKAEIWFKKAEEKRRHIRELEAMLSEGGQ